MNGYQRWPGEQEPEAVLRDSCGAAPYKRRRVSSGMFDFAVRDRSGTVVARSMPFPTMTGRDMAFDALPGRRRR